MRVKLSFLVLSLWVIPAGTAAAQSVCDEWSGNSQAFGLCNAYCEAMDCDDPDHRASKRACDRVFQKFEDFTGEAPPCACPCLSADYSVFSSFADEDFTGFETCTLTGSLTGDPLDFGLVLTARALETVAECGSTDPVNLPISSGAAVVCAELLIAAYETATMEACATGSP